MTTIGTAVLKVQADTKKFNSGVDKAEKKTGKLTKALKGAASQVPVLGGTLSSMVSPLGGLTLGIGALTAGLGAAVGKITAVEKELRPMIARSGLAGESLQVLTRAANALGSQDGLEAVTDGAQELQLRLAEAVQDGTGPAVAAFEKLGIATQELIEKSPEQSFLDVITALQGVTNAADRKFLADELMGGASEKLSGIVQATSEDFQALTDKISKQADIVSNEGLEAARQYSSQMVSLKATLGGLATSLGTAVLPILTSFLKLMQNEIMPVLRDVFMPIWDALKPAIGEVFKIFSEGLLPILKELWGFISPILIPTLKFLATILGGVIKSALSVVVNALKAVVSLLKGDWRAAWNSVKKMVLSALKGVISIYNNTIGKIPGMATIDIGKIEEKFGDLGDSAKEAGKEGMEPLAEGVEDVGAASKGATPEVAGMGKAIGEMGTSADDTFEELRKLTKQGSKDIYKALEETWAITAEEYDAANRKLRVASKDHRDKLQTMAEQEGEQDLAIMQVLYERQRASQREHHEKQKEAERKFLDDLAAENAIARDQKLAAELQSWGVEREQYIQAKALLRVANSEHIAMLQEEAMEAGIKDLALMQAIIDQEKKARIKGQQEMRTAEIAERRQTMQESAEVLRIGFKEQEEVIAFSMAKSAAEVAASAAQITASIEAIPSQKTITISTIQQISGSAGGVTGTDDQGGEHSTNVDLHGDGTGTVSTGNTGGEGGPASGSSQDFTLDESGNAYYDEGKTQPVDDDTQDAIDEVLGHSELARGGIVRPRAGGMVARLAEAGVPEAVIPLGSSRAMSMMGARGGARGGAGVTVKIENVYGFDDFAEKVAEVTNQNVRLGAL